MSEIAKAGVVVGATILTGTVVWVLGRAVVAWWKQKKALCDCCGIPFWSSESDQYYCEECMVKYRTKIMMWELHKMMSREVNVPISGQFAHLNQGTCERVFREFAPFI